MKQAAVTKIDAVRRAIAALGVTAATPEAVIKYVKEKHGISLSQSHCYNLKSVVMGEVRAKQALAPVPPPTKMPTVTPAEKRLPATTAILSPNGSPLVTKDDIVAIKMLVRRYGEGVVHSLANVVGIALAAD